MTYYQNTINEMVSIIVEKKLPYENTIIIGNNSSGKSVLLKRLLQKSGFEHWYLIDSVNRYFSRGFKSISHINKLRLLNAIFPAALNHSLKPCPSLFNNPHPTESLCDADIVARPNIFCRALFILVQKFNYIPVCNCNDIHTIYCVFFIMFMAKRYKCIAY